MHSIAIPLNELKTGMKLASSVFAHSGPSKNMIICRQDTFVTRRVINLLARHEVWKVDVYSGSPPIPASFDFDELQGENYGRFRIDGKTIEFDAPKVKPIFGDDIKQEAVDSIKGLFSAIGKPGEITNMTTAYQIVRGFEKTLSQVVAAATHDIKGIVHIQDLKSYDEYTYHHSISVSLLAVATGQILGFDLSDSMKLGRCALLHDIGKQFIPWEIINKKSKLSNEEFKEMMEHPRHGASNLKAKGLGSTGLINGILFHHEKVNGRGYPKGLAGEEIPLFSKIVSVADVFDALTSFRSYRRPLTPTDAYELINAEVGSSFDYDIVQAFTKKLDLYPLNSFIELSDGRIAMVVENQNVLRPVVMDVVTKEKFDLASSKNLSLSIARVVDRDDFALGA